MFVSVAGIKSRPTFDQLFQLIDIGRSLHSCIHCDRTLVIESRERLIEGLHAKLVLTGLHHRVDLMDFVFANQVSNGGVGNQYLKRHGATGSFGPRQTAPGTKCLQALAKAERESESVDRTGIRR